MESSSSKAAPYLPPCRICVSPASGFHYGVNTCEACKGFFRRSIARTRPYPPCKSEKDCLILTDSRNECTDCRFRKCLNAGMSKSAIKTGRYTHEKRTRDTLEIKCNVDVPSPSTDGVATPDAEDCAIPNRCEPLDYSVSTFNKNTIRSIDPMLNTELISISATFRQNFFDTTFLFEYPGKIDSMLQDMTCARKVCDTDTTELVLRIGASASPAQRDHYNKLQKQAQVVHSIQTMNKSVPKDQLLKLDSYKQAVKELYEIWSTNIEKLLQELIHFARGLNGFSQLSDSDKRILIKGARPEVTMLTKFKHFRRQPSGFIDYRVSSGTLCVIPTSTIELFFGDSDYSELFDRFMRQMGKLDVQLEHLAVMCAISLFSSDREDLSEEGKCNIEKIQEKLVPVLEYSLENSHINGKSILPNFLMLFPILRELNEHNHKAIMTSQGLLHPDFSPLLIEILPVTFLDSSRTALVPPLKRDDEGSDDDS